MVLLSRVIAYHTSNLSWISCHMLPPDWSQFAIDGNITAGKMPDLLHSLSKMPESLTEPQLPPPQTHPYTQTPQDSPTAVPGVLCIPLFSPFLSFFKAWPAFLNLLICFFSHTLTPFSFTPKLFQPGSVEVGLPHAKPVTFTESHRSIPQNLS